MNFLHPFTIHEAEVAIWHSRADGMTSTDPSGSASQLPAAQCPGSVKISQAPRSAEDSRHSNWQGSTDAHDSIYSLELSGLFGAYSDNNPARLELDRKGFFTVVIRWLDEASGQWRKLQFHYVTFNSSSIDGDPTLAETLSMTSPWLETTAGTIGLDGLPTMEPVVLGIIEWGHGGRTIATHRQELGTDDWESLPANTYTPAGGGGPLPLVALTESDANRILSLAYLDLSTPPPTGDAIRVTALTGIYADGNGDYLRETNTRYTMAGAASSASVWAFDWDVSTGGWWAIGQLRVDAGNPTGFSLNGLHIDAASGSDEPDGSSALGPSGRNYWLSTGVDPVALAGANEWNEASFLPRAAFSVGAHDSTGHGLAMDDDTELEAKGCPEALFAHLGRETEHRPEVRIRVLRRLYASIQNGILAVPQFSLQSPGSYAGPPLLFTASAATVNPSTEHTGITLLPEIAHLDGDFLGAIDENELLII